MKTLIGVIQSEANIYCQQDWIKNLKKLKGNYEVLIVENSYDDDNFNHLKTQFKKVLKGPSLDSVKDRIVENRNIVLNYFRNNKEFDNLLFIDTDIFPSEEALNELLKADKKIIGSVCWILGGAKTLRAAWNFFKKDIDSGNFTKWVKHLKQNESCIKPEAEVVKIREIGLGFTLFDGKILRTEQDLIFKVSKFQLNEDFTFIKELRARGYDAYINMKVNCFHDLRKVLNEEV